MILVKKQPVAKHFMLLTIGEAFAKFKNDFSQYEIGRSQFFGLRPRHVKPMSVHDTCCCLSHENFDLVLIMLSLLQAWNHLENKQIDRQTLFEHVLEENAAPAGINTHRATCCFISLEILMKTDNGTAMSLIITV